MSGQTSHPMDTHKRPLLGFKIFAASLTLVLVAVSMKEFINAWILREPLDAPHLWHIAELSALMFLLGGVMLRLCVRPRGEPLLAQYIVLSLHISALAILPFTALGLAFLALAALFLLTYPNRRALLSLKREQPISKILLAFTAMFAIWLDPIAWKEISYQIIGTGVDIHAMYLHWIGSALLMMLLILAGLFSATLRPGWKTLSILTGLIYIFLGIIAMMTVGYAGSWEQSGGMFSIFGGSAYLLLTWVVAENIRLKQGATEPGPGSILADEGQPVEVDTGPLSSQPIATEARPLSEVRETQKEEAHMR